LGESNRLSTTVAAVGALLSVPVAALAVVQLLQALDSGDSQEAVPPPVTQSAESIAVQPLMSTTISDPGSGAVEITPPDSSLATPAAAVPGAAVGEPSTSSALSTWPLAPQPGPSEGTIGQLTGATSPVASSGPVDGADDLPGTPLMLNSTARGVVDISDNPTDLFAISLRRGDVLRIVVSAPAGLDPVRLLSPESRTVEGDYDVLATWVQRGSIVEGSFEAPETGTYSVWIRASGRDQTYEITFSAAVAEIAT
jgi:hypothetical protein